MLKCCLLFYKPKQMNGRVKLVEMCDSSIFDRCQADNWNASDAVGRVLPQLKKKIAVSICIFCGLMKNARSMANNALSTARLR